MRRKTLDEAKSLTTLSQTRFRARTEETLLDCSAAQAETSRVPQGLTWGVVLDLFGLHLDFSGIVLRFGIAGDFIGI